MQRATAQYDPTGLFAALVYLVVLVWLFVQVIHVIERRVLRWQRR